MPDIEIKLVDQTNGKVHYYLIPKQQGEEAKHLRSVPLTFTNLKKNFCIEPKEYSKLEVYLSAVDDAAKEHCK